MHFLGRPWVHLGLILGSLVLVASAPAAPQPLDCSDKEQQVTVSHTYKIDVPKSALVQVEADTQPLADAGDSSILAPGEAGEEQNIIFRHNIRLQTPHKDCELAGLVQALLARVKKLEEDLVKVKEQCSGHCCAGAAVGKSHGLVVIQQTPSEHLHLCLGSRSLTYLLSDSCPAVFEVYMWETRKGGI